MMHIIHRELGW